MNKRFPWCAESQAILPVHTVWVQLKPKCLTDKSVHVTGFGREDLSVVEVNEEIIVEPMFRHRRFVWVSKLYVPVVLLYSGLNRLTSLSDVLLTTFTGYAVHP